MTTPPPSDEETLETQFADYLDDAMSPAERAAFEARLAQDASLQAAFESYQQTVRALSGLHKMAAPQDFEKGLEETIHRRSAGRFFGRKAFGDRVPFELLAVVALALLLAAFLLIRYAGDDPAAAPQIPPEAREAIPKP